MTLWSGLALVRSSVRWCRGIYNLLHAKGASDTWPAKAHGRECGKSPPSRGSLDGLSGVCVDVLVPKLHELTRCLSHLIKCSLLSFFLLGLVFCIPCLRACWSSPVICAVQMKAFLRAFTDRRIMDRCGLTHLPAPKEMHQPPLLHRLPCSMR